MSIQPDNNGNYRIEIGEKVYNFSQEQINKYPKLLDPQSKYIIGFDDILPIIYSYPESCIKADLLEANHTKQLFLSNCEWFGIVLEDSIILHLSSSMAKEIQEISEFIKEEVGKKGKKKLRFSVLREVQEFASDYIELFVSHNSDTNPIEVINLLELGTKKALDMLILKDFRSKNVILPFINAFLKKFLPNQS